MKKRLQHWITSILGILLFVFTGAMMYWDKLEVLESIPLFGLSILLLVAKDDLIKKYISKTLNIK